MELVLPTINRSAVVNCRLAWGLMDSPKPISEVAPLPAFSFR
jgi:hypothetical protein